MFTIPFSIYNNPSDNPDFISKEFSIELVKDIDNHEILEEINCHDYSMHGTVFKISDNSIHASFGGLLMKLTGIKVDRFMIDKKIYCLINIL